MKKIKPIIIVFILIYSQIVVAQKLQYASALIPEELKENTDAVVRNFEQKLTINNLNDGRLKVKKVITLLNQGADNVSDIYLDYDKLRNLKITNVEIYDYLGKQVKKMKDITIQDQSMHDGSLYSDNRIKKMSLKNSSYPYTFVLEYEYEYDGLLFYPSWSPYDFHENVSVEKSTLNVSVPSSFDLRYKIVNLDTPEKSEFNTNAEQATHYTWKVSNLPAVETEEFGPHSLEYFPAIHLAPNLFEIEGYKGDLSSWQSFGDWNRALNQGRGILDNEVQQVITDLTQSTENKREKVKLIYEYLQQNTRYVSIQLGIGGWQTFPAKMVHEKKYGDCKALSNFTQALLASVGIESYYTLIHAGNRPRPLFEDFPSNQFNHVILCVPMEEDSVWLECTSQNQAFDYMGTFTDNRNALLITPEGGKLVKTPSYSSADNLLEREATITIKKNGDASAIVSTKYQALQEGSLQFYVEYSKKDQEEYLYERLNIPSFTIDEFELNRNKEGLPYTSESLSLTIRNCASVSGNRLFIQPNLFNKWTRLLPDDENREQDVVLDRLYEFVDYDSLTYEFPEEFRVEYAPEETIIDSKFGTYKSKCIVEENKLMYIRTFEMHKGRYSKEDYTELKTFFEDVKKADNVKLVLVDKT